MKKKSTADAIPASSNAAEPEAGTEVQVLKPGLNMCCLPRDTLFNDLQNEDDPETGSVLTERVSLLLAESPFRTRRARGQSSSAHNMFSERDMKDSVRLMSSMMALKSDGHILCSDLIFSR